MTTKTVRTRSGPVQGGEEQGVHAFKGIPYAQAPFGDNRFRAPTEPPTWDGEFDAGEFGATAPAPGYLPPMDSILPAPMIAGDDCLNLTYHAGERDAQGQRHLPGGPYDMRPQGQHDGKFEMALFMRVPITHLTVVEGPNQQQLTERLKLAGAAGLPVVTSRE